MSTTTDMRDAYLAAELDILQHGRTTSLEGRTLTTADLPEIIAGRKEWERRVTEEARRDRGQSRSGYSLASFSE